jgi:hypothetical protein
MTKKDGFTTVLAVGAFVCFCQPLLGDTNLDLSMKRMEAREEWACRRTFEWELSIQHIPPERDPAPHFHTVPVWEVKTRMTIVRNGDTTVVSGAFPSPLPSDNVSTQAQAQPKIFLEPLTTYYGDRWAILVNGLYTENQLDKPVHHSGMAYQCPGSCADYPDLHPGIAAFAKRLPPDFIFLAGRNPLKSFGVEWAQNAQSPKPEFSAIYRYNLSPEAPVETRLSYRASPQYDDAPERFEMYTPRWSMLQRAVWESRSFTRREGNWVPNEVHIMLEYKDGTKITAQARLIRVSPSKPVAIDLDVGSNVSDFRLTPYQEIYDRFSIHSGSEKFVSYKWTGKLPTEEELKLMAFEQGRLYTAADTGGRRASWLLFLPAIAAFIGAGYFYKQLRRRTV